MISGKSEFRDDNAENKVATVVGPGARVFISGFLFVYRRIVGSTRFIDMTSFLFVQGSGRRFLHASNDREKENISLRTVRGQDRFQMTVMEDQASV